MEESPEVSAATPGGPESARGRLCLERGLEQDLGVIRCSGEIDMSNAASLEHELVACADLGAPVVELDLRGVTFLDSFAVRVIVMAHWQLAASGRRLEVRAEGFAAQLFRWAQLDGLLTA